MKVKQSKLELRPAYTSLTKPLFNIPHQALNVFNLDFAL